MIALIIQEDELFDPRFKEILIKNGKEPNHYHYIKDAWLKAKNHIVFKLEWRSDIDRYEFEKYLNSIGIVKNIKEKTIHPVKIKTNLDIDGNELDQDLEEYDEDLSKAELLHKE